MSICMPLSDESFRPVVRVLARAGTPCGGETEPGNPAEKRISNLESRLDRLETGHLTALNLVRRALTTLKDSQTTQEAAHSRAISRLAAQLAECESALARMDAARRQDDEAMRERLFDMGEALEGVRAVAASAIRPAALHRLEQKLAREIEANADTLRTELGEQIADSVEAAESRSAQAIGELEDYFWDDITEIARRFDCLADTVVKIRLQSERAGEAHSPFGTPARPDPHPDESRAARRDSPGDIARSAVIPFPPQQTAVRDDDERRMSGSHNIGAVLSAAARRAGQPGEPSEENNEETERTLSPLGRIVSSAGSAVMAVCIMGGLSLLAGPALGPSLQGAPPAFAHGNGAWTPVAAESLPVTMELRLGLITKGGDQPYPVTFADGATSDR